MKIFKASEVQLIDKYTIENEPIASIDLMERAATALTDWYVRRFRVNRRVLIFAGPGNNGGDALAMARLLAERKYRIECFLVSSSANLSKDCSENLQRLKEQGKVAFSRIKSLKEFPSTDNEDVIIDGLFGSGLSRPAEGIYRDIIRAMNESEANLISIDIPSGLFGEDNSKNNADSIVKANNTLSFQFPFLSFLFAENHDFVGKWQVLDIGLHPDAIRDTASSYSLAERKNAKALLPSRNTFTHKGSAGHALIIAGSYGMMGAAILAGEASLRSGCGLVSLHIPEGERFIVQSAFPEAVLSLDAHKRVFSKLPELKPYNAIAVGPGLGTERASVSALRKLLETVNIPLLIDADALNLLAQNPDQTPLLQDPQLNHARRSLLLLPIEDLLPEPTKIQLFHLEHLHFRQLPFQGFRLN